jgi:hypothetical protein
LSGQAIVLQPQISHADCVLDRVFRAGIIAT